MVERESSSLAQNIMTTCVGAMKGNIKLSDDIRNALEGGDFDPAQVSAALQLIEGMSRAVREVIDNKPGKEQAIFAALPPLDGQVVEEVDLPAVSLSAPKENSEEKPKTFGELLTLKLDKALPDGQEQFTREDLRVILGGIKDSNSILKKQKESMFNRETTVRILTEILTTPRSPLKNDRRFSRMELMLDFTVRASEIDRWSDDVGHVWSKEKTVDSATAVWIRGLGKLKKLNIPPKKTS